MKIFLPLTRAFSGRFLSAAGVIALSITMSRQLSLTEAGLFFEAFITLMGVAIAVQFGMPTVILRTVARLGDDPGEADAILGRALASLCAISGIVVALWLTFFYVTSGFHTPTAWVWLNILPTAAMGPLSSYLKAKGYPGRGGFWEVGILSLIACGVMLVAPPKDAMTAWIVFSSACWVGMTAAVVLAGTRHFRPFVRPVLDIPLLFEGRFLWLMSVLAYMSLWGGVLISNWLLAESYTAVLNALFRTLAPLQFLILTVDFYMAPKFASAQGLQLWKLYTKARTTCTFMALPYALLTLTFPSVFLSTVFGESFAQFDTEMRLIVVAIMVQIALGPTGILLNMHGLDRATLLCMVLRSTVYLTLSIFLGLEFGVFGIAAALAVSTILQALVQYSIAVKNFH